MAIRLPLVKDHCNISSNKTTIKLLDGTNQEKVGFTLGKEGEKKDEEMKRADKEGTSRERDEVGILCALGKVPVRMPRDICRRKFKNKKVSFSTWSCLYNTMM